MINKTFFIFNTLLAIVFFFVIKSCNMYKKECKRLETNIESLMTDIHYYKSNAGREVASISILTMKRREFREFCNVNYNIIDELGLKLKRVKSYCDIVSDTKLDIVTQIDTVRILDSIEIRSFSWNDAWCSVNGDIINNKKINGLDSAIVKCRIENRDTIFQIIHRVPRRFLFIKYGTKAIKQEIISANPHTKIVYSKYIKLN